ncbi:energy transducer TonB [Ideonella dechloratans]|uniref:energy transducer TonB n=1 Tax=Ideonella dechloratans TaxID=36863 RepID=UPI0035AD937C
MKSPVVSHAGLALFTSLLLVAPGAHADPKILKKVPPDFPQEAVRRNVPSGVLQTQLAIDGQGNVTEVKVVNASPPPARVFKDAATEALMKWKFEGSGKPDTAEVKLVFSQE